MKILFYFFFISLSIAYSQSGGSSITIFESSKPIKALDFNNNLNHIKNELEKKNTQVSFSNYLPGHIIDKEQIEDDFDVVRDLGVVVSPLLSDSIVAAELNNAFQQMVAGVSLFNDKPISYNSDFSINEDSTLSNKVNFENVVGTSIVQIGMPVSNGTLSLNEFSGEFQYTPSLNYYGTDSFSFRIFDGSKYSEYSSVSIEIAPINDPPEVNTQSISVNEDIAFSGILSGSDVDNNLLTYSIVAQGIKGVVSVVNSTQGSFIYTPNSNATGSDSFSFKANDGSLDSTTKTISVTINAVHDAPMANNQSISVLEDGVFSGVLDGIDVDGNSISYSIVSQPANGTAIVNNAATGSFSYTPSSNFNGSDSFSFKVNDGTVDSNLAIVSITVSPVNDKPVANYQTFTVSEYQTFAGSLTGFDVDGDVLSYSIEENAAKGSIVLNQADGSFNYTPNQGVGGNDSFVFKVSDGQQFSTAVRVHLNINPVDSSCENIRSRGFPSGYYEIDFDVFGSGAEPIKLYCEFDIEAGKAWTQVAVVNKNSTLWNAWSDDLNVVRTDYTSNFGIALDRFSDDGKNLEVLIKVDNQHRNIIYYDVDLSKSFNPSYSSGTSTQVQDGFFYRVLSENSYTRCGVTIESANNQWNWSIADSADSSCGGYSSKGGFLLASNNVANPEIANSIYGLNFYNNFESFSRVEVFIRERILQYPISCQQGYEKGLVTVSGYYNIDVDSDGVAQNVYCSVGSGVAYTLLINFGNNTDYNNRGVLRNGLVNNSQAAVTAAGFSTNATSWNNTNYTTSTSYLQFFLGGDSTGYIAIAGPKWGSVVSSTYRALNGPSTYSRFRINNVFGNTNYNVIAGNNSTTATIGYSHKDSATLFWEEYPSGVAAIDVIWIK